MSGGLRIASFCARGNTDSIGQKRMNASRTDHVSYLAHAGYGEAADGKSQFAVGALAIAQQFIQDRSEDLNGRERKGFPSGYGLKRRPIRELLIPTGQSFTCQVESRAAKRAKGRGNRSKMTLTASSSAPSIDWSNPAHGIWPDIPVEFL